VEEDDWGSDRDIDIGVNEFTWEVLENSVLVLQCADSACDINLDI
jgi:hypothetical protein